MKLYFCILFYFLDDSAGSEHFVNGLSYPAEVALLYKTQLSNLKLKFNIKYKYFKLHFVHWNKEKFKNAQDALASSDHSGVLVLAVFLEVSFV